MASPNFEPLPGPVYFPPIDHDIKSMVDIDSMVAILHAIDMEFIIREQPLPLQPRYDLYPVMPDAPEGPERGLVQVGVTRRDNADPSNVGRLTLNVYTDELGEAVFAAPADQRRGPARYSRRYRTPIHPAELIPLAAVADQIAHASN